MNKMVLSNQQFSNLLDVLSLIKDDHNDADIRQGIIRQIAISRVYIFEANLTTLIGENDLVLPMIKNKVSLLYALQSDNVELYIDDRYYTFFDGVSELKFNKNSSQYLDNKYMTEQEMSEKFVLDDSNIIFSVDIDKVLQNKIKIFSDNFNVDDLMIDIVDGNADLYIMSFSNTGNAKIVKDIPVSNIDGNKRINISARPFVLNYTETVNMCVYRTDKEDYIVVKLSSNLGDVPFSIYIPGFLEDL